MHADNIMHVVEGTSAKIIDLNELDLKFSVPKDTTINEYSTDDFIERIKLINKLPFNKANIYFTDMVWDFQEFTTLSIPRKVLVFKFDKCPEEFRDELKAYVLIQMLDRKTKVQTIHKNATYIRKFFSYAKSKGYLYVEDIPDSVIRGYINSEIRAGLTATSIAFIRGALKGFYRYYAVNFKDLITTERAKLFETEDVNELYATKESSKLPDIPENYFMAFLQAIITVAKDKTEKVTNRAIACIYIILSQTGLRIGEILNLEIDDLMATTIFNGESVHYLRYKTWKREKGNNVFSYEITYINELSKFAFDLLTELYSDGRKKLNTNLLYIGNLWYYKRKEIKLPIESGVFEKSAVKFFAYLNKFFPTVDVPEELYPGINIKQVSKDPAVTRQYPSAKTLAKPRNHQFRVHVCSVLYKKGVPLDYINKYMSHLTETMTDYYIRITPSNPQEDMEFSFNILEKIVKGELKLLGGKDADGIVKRINEFIEKNGFNVKTDVKEICDSLLNRMPIRPKTGGVCIKSSLRECSIDAKTDDFYCAYEICPNLYHFYYMAAVSYRQYKELKEAISINRKNGFKRQVEKEEHRIKYLISNRLLPELKELASVIEEKGANAVISQYPDLTDIIVNYDSIFAEVNEWKLEN